MTLHYQIITWNILLTFNNLAVQSVNSCYSSDNNELQVTAHDNFVNRSIIQNEHDDYSRNTTNTSITTMDKQPTVINETEHEKNVRLTINYRDTDIGEALEDKNNNLCLFDKLLENLNVVETKPSIDRLPTTPNKNKSLLSQLLDGENVSEKSQYTELPDHQPIESIVLVSSDNSIQYKLFQGIFQNTNDPDKFIIEVKHFSPLLTEPFTNLKLADKINDYNSIDNFAAYVCVKEKLSGVLQVLFYHKFIDDNELNKMLKTFSLSSFKNTPQYEAFIDNINSEPDWFKF